MKTCSRCLVNQSLDSFVRQKSSPDGYSYWCRQCATTWRRERRRMCPQSNGLDRLANVRSLAKHRAQYNSGRRIKWQADPAKYAQQNRMNYLRHREDRILKQRLWNAANRERISKNNRAYQKRRPDVTGNCRARKRARKASAVCTLTQSEWAEIKARQKALCAYCYKRRKLTMEHITPLSKGGEHSARNIIGVCLSCNCAKGSKMSVPTPVQPFLIA